MITTQPRQAPAKSPAIITTKSIVERMADRVLELGMNSIAVTKDVLEEHTDFTRSEIEQHAKDACDLAKSRAVRHQG